MPLILRGVKIIGINAESTSNILRKKIWKKITKLISEKKIKEIYQECKLSNVIDIIKLAKIKNSVGRIIVKIN